MRYVLKQFNLKRAGTVISLAVAASGLGASVQAQVEPQPLPAAASPTASSSTVRTAPVSSTVPVVSGLSEQPRLINACRFSPEQSLYIYEDAARTRLIRTLTAQLKAYF